MLKKMNLPNKITILRIILVPIFIVFMALPTDWAWTKWTALGIYVVASLTDFVDGYISRKYNMVTKFGKIMDPLADKLLVSAGFVIHVELNSSPSRLTAFRNFGSDNNSDVGAVFSGKIKTVFQLIGISLAILGTALYTSYNGFGEFIFSAVNMSMIQLMINVLMSVSIVVAVIFTLWSLVDYFLKFKKDINVEE